MKTLKNDRLLEVREHMAGGEGSCQVHHILRAEDAYGAGRLFAVNTLQPGSSIGVHEHHGEFEIYYILDGTATITDNSEVYELHAGDMMECRDGDSHGIANTSDAPMSFLALILNCAK